MSSPVARFAFVGAGQRRSMTWRLWTGSTKATDEVYLAPRHMAGDFKISLHADGYRQAGPTKRLRDRSSPDDRYAEARWNDETEHGAMVRILVHRSQFRARDIDAAEIQIQCPEDEDAWLVLITAESPKRFNGFRAVGSVQRATLSPVSVLVAPVPASNPYLDLVGEKLDEPESIWSLPVDWPRTPFGYADVDDGMGTPLLVEFSRDLPDGDLEQKWFRDFPGDVRPMRLCPIEGPDGVDICAAVAHRDDGATTLYLNEHARCDHSQLADYATSLIHGPRPDHDERWDLVDPSDPSRGQITWLVTAAADQRRRSTREPGRAGSTDLA